MTKTKILNFIMKTMDEYVVDRMIEITEDRDEDDERFVSSEEFERIQKECVSKLKEEDITLLNLLIKK